jgi:hypothetical protein
VHHRLGRWQFTLKQLLIAVAVVALILGLYYWVMAVDVHEVPAGAPVAQRYFGFISPQDYCGTLTEKDVRARNIARVCGRFFGNGSNLLATLYLVDGGKVTEINSLSVGQSSSRLGVPFGEYLRITFALGDFDAPEGRVTSLGSIGHTAGAGSGGPHPHKVTSSAHILVTGRVGRGEARVVYAEGDRPPIVTFGMRVEDFAERNRGSFLAVTMRLK